jgi:hypothetical protein
LESKRIVTISGQDVILLSLGQPIETLYKVTAGVIKTAIFAGCHNRRVQRNWLLDGSLCQGSVVIPLSSGHSPWLCSSLSLGLLEFHLATKCQQTITNLSLTKRNRHSSLRYRAA